MLQREVKPPDGGYGWIIVIAVFLSNVILQGFVFSPRIFLAYFEEHFNAPEHCVSWINSMTIGCTLLFGPLSSVFTAKYGFRKTVIIGSIVVSASLCLSSTITTLNKLKFTYILTGVGSALVYFSGQSCILHYFSTKRPIAMGIFATSVFVGIFMFVPLLQFLLNLYNFDGTMIICGALVLNCIVFGGLLRPLQPTLYYKRQYKSLNQTYFNSKMHGNDPAILKQNAISVIYTQDQLQNIKNHTSLFLGNISNNSANHKLHFKNFAKTLCRAIGLHLFKNAAFSFICFGTLFGMMSFTIPLTYMVHNGITKGVNEKNATFLMSIYGITSLLTRPIIGLIASSPKIDVLVMHNICNYICGFAMLISTICFSYLGLAITTALISSTSGATVTLIPVVLVDIIGLKHLHEAIALVGTFQGIAWLFTTPFAGLLFDVTRSYDYVFYLGGISVIFYAILMTTVSVLPRISRHSNRDGKKSFP